jgi:LysR family cyn operon transcriptional activator
MRNHCYANGAKASALFSRRGRQRERYARCAELRLTQPTLSHQIKQLEDELGTTLLDRVGRKVRLTAPAATFKEHVEHALKELQSGTAALAQLEGLLHGTLTIGVFQSFNSSLLPPILAQFSAAHPGVNVTVRQLPTGEMEARLIKGELDLGIAYVPPASDRIVAEKLFDEPLMLVVGDRHAYARRRKIHIKELRDQHLILLTPEFPSRKLLADCFASINCQPRIRIEINSTDAILAPSDAVSWQRYRPDAWPLLSPGFTASGSCPS